MSAHKQKSGLVLTWAPAADRDPPQPRTVHGFRSLNRVNNGDRVPGANGDSRWLEGFRPEPGAGEPLAHVGRPGRVSAPRLRSAGEPGPAPCPGPGPGRGEAGARAHVRRWTRAEGRPGYSLSHRSSAAAGPGGPPADSAAAAAMGPAAPLRPRTPLPPAAAANGRAPGLQTRQARMRT